MGNLPNVISALVALCSIVAPSGSLEQGFANPPTWAKPYTWWHWMAGNVTRQGITADLEAMKYAGIGGAHIFDAGQGIPRGPVDYNSPQWRDLMAFAMSEAQRLGLDMTMHNCSGWSSSGGPWVQPEDAMKKVVWSTTRISQATPGEANLALPTPPTVEGYYRDIGVYILPQTAPAGNDANAYNGLSGNPSDSNITNWPIVPEGIPASLGEDGLLHTNLAAGDWVVLRLGYTLTGARNVASRPTGEGLEVDKLSSASLDHFMEGGLVPLFERIGAPVGKSFRTVLIDSYETGHQNWTPSLIADFKRLRGYDPTKYLPALAGYAVIDRKVTDKFLFDFRRTLADLWAQNYSGHFAQRLKRYGLQLAVEPYGNGDFDPFTYAKPAGLVMGEYWVGEGTINGSVKPSASVAHVYGHSVVGAEALTAGASQAGWRNQPKQWKPFADRGYATGINRIIYHRFAHQPWPKNVVPGMTMGPWGSHVDRTETFWPYMPAWDQYLARCQYLLQSGLFVADVCVFTGEGEPQEFAGQGYGLPAVPQGYDYDLCGRDPLLTLRAKDGRLMLPNGASYRLLALPQNGKMTAEVARKIRSLVADGATVVGPMPDGSPSLADGGSGDDEVRSIGRRLWGDGAPGVHNFGKGRVIVGRSIGQVLSILGVRPDMATESRKLASIHRHIGDADAYFLASSQPTPRTVRCTFRVTGKTPEIWDAESGKIEDASIWKPLPGGTQVDIPLQGDGSAFVVFRNAVRNANPVSELKVLETRTSTKSAPAIKILKAEYGAIGQAGKVRDVTAIVRSAVEGPGVSIAASNDVMGGDPAYLVVKSLRVSYRLGDRTRTVVVPEGDTFAAGLVGGLGEPPVVELNGDKLSVWQNGKFLVRRASGTSLSIVQTNVPTPLTIAGPWRVSFPAGWDAPAQTVFPSLTSWSDNKNFGIRYFSGTAIYGKTLTVPASMLGSGKRIMLDLGDVREFARLRLNGKPVAEFWKAPFRADVTAYVRAGANKLEVDVTNLWVNRLIGDEQFPDDMGWNGDVLKGWPEWFVKGLPRPEPRRKTFTTWHHNRKDTPLMPSGLLGPVVLRTVRVVSIK